MSPARLCAFRTLRRVEDDGAFADRALRAEANRAGLDGRERAFAQQLAYGTVQRKLTLDHLIGSLATRPADRLDAPLRDALRLGLQQLLFLDSVPDHAAVAQTVEAAKTCSPGGGHRLANAVMRRATREAAATLAALGDATPEAAAIRHSHPEWLVRMWWDALGRDETLALLAHDNEPAESALRANELRASAVEVRRQLERDGVGARPADDLPEGLVLDAPYDVHGSPLYEDGLVMPQSRGSMLVARVVDPRPGERVLDLCAAPGAKTTHLAALMRGEGAIVAVEANAARARALRENCRRLGAANVEVLASDAAAPLEREGFDRVLLDPPCSDLGTLQSRPDARWRKGPDVVERLRAEQDRLLEAAAAQLRPQGALVYSTCTISPLENEERMAAFLGSHPELEADELGSELPRYAHRGDPRYLQLLPHRHATDGFFVARLRRTGAR